jgi:hypothetical protein
VALEEADRVENLRLERISAAQQARHQASPQKACGPHAFAALEVSVYEQHGFLVLYVGTYGSYSIASKAVGMTPYETKGKLQKRNGELTGERGPPTFQYKEAANQVRGTTKGPHKNGAKLYYFIYAYQAAGLDLQLAGDMEAERVQSLAVIQKLNGRKVNNKEARLKLKDVQEAKKRKTHEGSTSAPSKKAKRGSE